MRRVFLLCSLAIFCAATIPSAAASRPTEDAVVKNRLILVLDSSGSMKESAAGGSKIDAARKALKDVVAKLPGDAEVGMRVFGAKVFSKQDAGACEDTQNVVPVGPLDRARLTKAIGSYQPYGETPIGNALTGAAADLGPAVAGQKHTIVLLSDGEPTCAPDPCAVARELRAQGVDLKVNVVGLSVSGQARDKLQCIARAGGGSYTDVDDADELSDSLVQASVRGFRAFRIAGKPVTGGPTIATAEPLEPGQYTDAVPREGVDRYYLVDVPKGGRIAASVTARPERDGGVQDLGVALLTPEGRECDEPIGYRDNLLKTRTIITSSATYDPHAFSDNEPCSAATQYVVRVSWQGKLTDVAYELLVDTFPPAANYDALPSGVPDAEPFERPVRASGLGIPVVGGASFADAPLLAPGTYADTIRPGEQLLYRVHVDWGQSARATTTLQTFPGSGDIVSSTGIYVGNTMITPLRETLTQYYNSATGVDRSVLFNGDEPGTITTLTPAVRLKNADLNDYEVDPSWFAGDYYLSIEMGQALGDGREDWAAPITIAVAVDGAVEGKPDYQGKATGPNSAKPDLKPPPVDERDSPVDLPWGWLGIGAGAIALLGGGFLLGRRRST